MFTISRTSFPEIFLDAHNFLIRTIGVYGHVIFWRDLPFLNLIFVMISMYRYWLWRSPNDVLYKAYDLYKYLVRFPCQVSFAGYQQKQSSDSSKFEVKLTCVAITKQQELTKYLDEKMGKY